MKRFVLLIFTLFVTACQVPHDIEQDPIDLALLDKQNTPPVIGKSNLAVRTFLDNGGDEPVEVSGAACTIRSSQFRADFQSPAWLNMPTTRGAPKPLKLTCRANGKSASLDLPPVQIITSVGVNTGELLSSLVATAIVGGATMEASRAANVWGYRYHGEKVMGLDNELLVLRLLLE